MIHDTKLKYLKGRESMQESKVLNVILFLAGLLILVVGSATLFFPVEFSAKHGVILAQDVSLFNDIRGLGGLMLGSGLLIISGAFVKQMRFTSAMVGSVIYLTFAMARVVSIVLDGVPAEGLIKATVIETVMGLLVLVALIKYREVAKP